MFGGNERANMFKWLEGMKGVELQLPSVIFTDSVRFLPRRRGTTGVWGRSPQVLNDTNTHLKTFHIIYCSGGCR